MVGSAHPTLVPPFAQNALCSKRKHTVNRETLREVTVFGLLLAIGVVGRWYQLSWNFTPLAAVTILGGYYFRQTLAAVLLPLSILTVSNLLLPAYPHWQVHVSVYAIMLVPIALGRAARGAQGWQQAGRFALCGFVPATLFFAVTNLAVWAFTPYYQKTLAGLANCYVAAIPFYRWMLAGDLFFLTLLIGCLALAQAWTPRSAQIANQ